MTLETRTARVVAALRSASSELATLKDRTLPSPISGAGEVAAGALLRVPGLAHAIALLLENGLVLECEPVVRALLETAINIAWIGADEQKATAFKADSGRQLRLWIAEIAKNQVLPAEALSSANALVDAWSASGALDVGSLESRARTASVDTPHLQIPTLSGLYEKYRRLSGPSHGDLRADTLAIANKSALAHLDALDAATAMVICVVTAAQTLNISTQIDAVVGPLRTVLQAASHNSN